MPITLDCIIFGLQQFGGISNYWRQLIRHAILLDQDIELIMPKNHIYSDLNRLPLDKITLKNENLPPSLTRYMMAMSSSQAIDVFHTSYYRTPQVNVKNYLVTLYDFTYEKYFHGIKKTVHSLQKFHSLKKADTIICISNSTKSDLINYIPNIKPDNIFVIPLAVDNQTFFPAHELYKEYNNVVLFVGGRSHYKRFDLAVESIAEIKDLRLGIIGAPLTKNEKEYLTRKLGIRWIEFGVMKSTDMHKIYSSSYAFIFPSDYEGFGLPILEAMACACPVVSSANSSLPEVGANAALYAESQIIDTYIDQLNILRNHEKRKNLIKQGIERVQLFSWENTIKQTINLYYR